MQEGDIAVERNHGNSTPNAIMITMTEHAMLIEEKNNAAKIRNQIKRSRSMFGLNIDTANYAANVVYLFSLAIALVSSLFIYLLNSQISKVKEEELTRFQAQSQEEIAKAQSIGAKAQERAAALTVEIEKTRAENLKLSIKLEEERTERLRLVEKISSRSLTPEQERILRGGR